MRTTLALTAGLVLLTASVAEAQKPPTLQTTLLRAFEREADRAARMADASTQVAVGDWSAVRQLPPGETIRLLIDDTGRVDRVFLGADHAEIVVLNLNPLNNRSAKRTLQRAAAEHPEVLIRLRPDDDLAMENGVRIAGGIVFLNDRRLADLNLVLSRHARSTVREVGLPRLNPDRFVLATIGAVGGFFGGIFLGAAIENAVAPCSCDDPGLQGALIGLAVGPVAGGIAGYHLGKAPPKVSVIYAR